MKEGGTMLTRHNYYEQKRSKIKRLVLEVLNDLSQMTELYTAYLNHPTDERRGWILKTESDVNKHEARIEKDILEIISLQQLDVKELRWLLGMNRIIRELERIGDQLTNIVTLSDVADTQALKPMIQTFFHFESEMIEWVKKGITNEDKQILEDVMEQDHYVNQLNKGTYNNLVHLINEKENITESNLKTIIISRFLERIGDHLVNIARVYLEVCEEMED
ncbi:phosphate uptake regulator PhoU [Virgibacillus sp. 179-BFC.A HS]|uniref:Phosphate uptake regulator PhoU n=1 Tax=Tigheibacillus jepli TaxID=3035914 RepID=A0ABU5CJ58_9BACI|nr:phosphate uptake regulator PhoU [Virgibacillus sp. 179-BFC.A HS]MDY0406384.1 phosphate uptake regulator PhoU [Virgibacillus sp. 179-BFC.A HS]